MSDELMQHGHNGHGHNGDVEYEHEDLGTHGVFVFMIVLVVTGFVSYFIIDGMYKFLDKYAKSQMVSASPLVKPVDPMSRVYTQDEMDKTFKDNGAPMLETNEMGQFRGFLLDQEDQLNSYGWVDEKAGVAHIPITEAMKLTEGKIPLYTPGAAETKAPAQKAAGKGK